MVINTKLSDDCIRRRRKCLDCGFRFSTYESASVMTRRAFIEEMKNDLLMNVGEAIRKTIEEQEGL